MAMLFYFHEQNFTEIGHRLGYCVDQKTDFENGGRPRCWILNLNLKIEIKI